MKSWYLKLHRNASSCFQSSQMVKQFRGIHPFVAYAVSSCALTNTILRIAFFLSPDLDLNLAITAGK